MATRASSGNGTLRFGVFELGVETGELHKSGHKVRLRPQAAKVLILLAGRGGQLVTREELKSEIWGTDTFVDFEHGLNLCVRQIRAVLDDDANTPRYIETLPRRGYRFIAPVNRDGHARGFAAESLNGSDPEVLSEALPPNVPTLQKSPLRRRTRWPWIGAACLFPLLLGAAVLLLQRGPSAVDRSEWVALTEFTDSVTSPALSPDGRMLTFIRGPKTFFGPGEVYIKLLPSGEAVQLTHDGRSKMSPTFSPDGSRIAYTVPYDTWTVPVLGGDAKRWLPNASGLVWTDPQHILFSEVRHGWNMGIETATENRAGQRDIYFPAADNGMAHRSYRSPDGKWVLLAEMRGTWERCRVLPFDGRSTGFKVGPDGACTSGAWSPDGTWVYLTSSAGGAFHIWRQRLPNGKPQQLTSGPTEEDGIAMAPDGRSFITSVGLVRSTIWLHDQHGDRQITSEGLAWLDPIGSTFSPDARKLYYLRQSTPSLGMSGESGTNSYAYAVGELWTADLDSGKSERLLPGFSVADYAVAPDGKVVAVSTQGSAGNRQAWLVSTEHRYPPRQLPGVDAFRLAFGRSGDLYYVHREGSQNYLYRMRQEDTRAVRVTEQPISGFRGVSPDERDVMVIVPIGGEAMTAAAVLPLNGDPPALVCVRCYTNWDAAGKFLYISFWDSPDTGTYVLPVRRDNWLPESLRNEPLRAQDMSEILGARSLNASEIPIANATVSPAPADNTYAYIRTMAQRNLFRIPVH
jgi:DNA-binding winged helix-turn-helix (wHTH) protein/Tol biopolymer transport system component